MSLGSGTFAQAEVTLPRGLLLARAWDQLGDSVAPLSNASGRPLARTVKLILDPLVLRPVQNPRFAGGAIRIEHMDELRQTILDAGPALTATSAWFVLLKKTRRKAGITEGNPQDLYFQRCYELAQSHGDPRTAPDASAQIAVESVEEIHESVSRMSVGQLRRFITDPGQAGELTQLLRTAWENAWSATAAPSEESRIAGFLATCATAPDANLFRSLVTDRTGTREAVELDRAGVALGYGLTDRVQVTPPTLGENASKSHLPRPFDRSILERLFAGFTAVFHRESMDSIPVLVRQEIRRSAEPWQLAQEFSRVAMLLGRDASVGLGDDVETVGRSATPTTDAQVRLRSRWHREAYVHRVLRMPSINADCVPDDVRAEIRAVRPAYLRRLWVRLHGRELRREELSGPDIWDVLDGVLRSVIMDQRDRLRAVLERQASEGR